MSWPGAIKGHDLETGKVLWSAQGLTDLVYTSPVANQEVIVGMSGYGGAALAIRAEDQAISPKPTDFGITPKTLSASEAE